MTKPQPDTSLDDALTLTEPCFLLIEDINADAFLRDRTQLDDETIHELMLSITLHSLRTPIEVVELEGTPPWGLISGRRRLEAMKRLGHTKVPAVVRTPEDAAAVLKLVVEENAMREGITPWEQGRFIVTSVRQGYYPSTEEAVNALFNTQTRQKRMRLRALATAFDYFDGRLNDPHSYSEHKLRRLAAAAEAGLDEVMDAALADLRRDASPARAMAGPRTAVLGGRAARQTAPRRQTPRLPPPPRRPSRPQSHECPPRTHPPRLEPRLHRLRGHRVPDGRHHGLRGKMVRRYGLGRPIAVPGPSP